MSIAGDMTKRHVGHEIFGVRVFTYVRLAAEFMHIYPVIRMLAALAIASIGAVGMYIPMVALKLAGAEFEAGRGLSSLPYTATMIGFGLGGILMGRLSDRYGVMRTGFIAAVCLPLGLILAGNSGSMWEYCLIHGLLIGGLGCSATFAPLVADISHWFQRRRGVAVAVVISGSYVAGTIWPPVMEHLFQLYGWRETYTIIGWFSLAALLPLVLILYRPAPVGLYTTAEQRAVNPQSPLGFKPGSLQGLLCVAGVGCCVAMAMPQVHIVAYATDLGYTLQDAARMLSLMLGFGVISRLLSGWISDQIGGLRTLILGSGMQAVMVLLFLFFDSLAALYILSALFGLAQGGVVPSYTIIIRTFFVPEQAGWRIAAVMFFTMLGMALGGWIAGALYDLTGSYDAAFLNAAAFNLMNLLIAGMLLYRGRTSIPVTNPV